MTLLFKPKYNYILDCTYTRKGRGKIINSGLANPMRYGLTREQVKMLIEKGQWSVFLDCWTTKRRKYLLKMNLVCYLCETPCNNFIVMLGKRLCHRCCKKIDETVGVAVK